MTGMRSYINTNKNGNGGVHILAAPPEKPCKAMTLKVGMENGGHIQ